MILAKNDPPKNDPPKSEKMILTKMIFSLQGLGSDSATAAINVHPMDCSVNLSVHQVGEDGDHVHQVVEDVHRGDKFKDADAGNRGGWWPFENTGGWWHFIHSLSTLLAGSYTLCVIIQKNGDLSSEDAEE